MHEFERKTVERNKIKSSRGNKNKKIKNNNETISSIGNISNKEIDDNKISKKIKKKNLFNKDSEYEKDNKNKNSNSINETEKDIISNINNANKEEIKNKINPEKNEKEDISETFDKFEKPLEESPLNMSNNTERKIRKKNINEIQLKMKRNSVPNLLKGKKSYHNNLNQNNENRRRGGKNRGRGGRGRGGRGRGKGGQFRFNENDFPEFEK